MLLSMTRTFPPIIDDLLTKRNMTSLQSNQEILLYFENPLLIIYLEIKLKSCQKYISKQRYKYIFNVGINMIFRFHLYFCPKYVVLVFGSSIKSMLLHIEI